MEILEFKSEYFNLKDTLDCGQIFRYKSINGGFLVFSGDFVCKAYQNGNATIIKCENKDYFENFFDLNEDYQKINISALSSPYEIVKKSAELGKGIRILNQQKEEMLFSFIISQNNMIPRIKTIIERTCLALGEKKIFDGEEYYTFPSASVLASKDEQFFKDLGYGYRAKYMVEVAKAIVCGEIDLENISSLPTKELKKRLLALKGVGEKVADCVALFGFHKVDSFPVDTWIEKIYRENFSGKLTDRKKITEWFLSEFKEFAGYIQQYLFYYKRSLEKYEKN
ncbi:MAG: hypothetical protein IJW64_00265 [Clostridia bacterium]|nr:hypothetical protein [Clostridia bacterium]